MGRFSLVGVDGNAFGIMAYTGSALREAGLGHLKSEMMDRAMSGDYDNVIRVCMEYIDMANEAMEERDEENL